MSLEIRKITQELTDEACIKVTVEALTASGTSFTESKTFCEDLWGKSTRHAIDEILGKDQWTLPHKKEDQ